MRTYIIRRVLLLIPTFLLLTILVFLSVRKERVIILRHVIKNALIPVVTLIGMQLPILVGGSVIMENRFAMPGLGRLMLDALSARDYPVVSGINLFFATAVMTINLLIDILYGYLDPRVKYR